MADSGVRPDVFRLYVAARFCDRPVRGGVIVYPLTAVFLE